MIEVRLCKLKQSRSSHCRNTMFQHMGWTPADDYEDHVEIFLDGIKYNLDNDKEFLSELQNGDTTPEGTVLCTIYHELAHRWVGASKEVSYNERKVNNIALFLMKIEGETEC